VTRLVYGAFVVLIAVFVVSNVWQVAVVVFAEPTELGPRVTDVRCQEALKKEIQAIETARQRAISEESVESARSRYEHERAETTETRRDAPSTACASDPQGAAALAALAQLDRASESRALRDVGELRPVRLFARSFISGHPR
jgi:hypothetical protein